MLQASNIDCSPIWHRSDDWSEFGIILDQWVANTARYLAAAVAASCSVVDFDAAIIDGDFPPDIRSRLVTSTIEELRYLDLQGISKPQIFEGTVGRGARALGGASLPLFFPILTGSECAF